MDLKRAFINSSFWTGIGRYSQYGVQLVVTAILARLLSPEAFGILAMVSVFNGFVIVLSQAGVSSTIIQKKELNDRDLSTVFWFSTAISLLCMVIIILLSPLIEQFYKYDGLSLVVKVISINLLLVGIMSVPDGKLKRNLKFKHLAFADVISAVVSGFIAVIMAYDGFGYWALVFQLIIYSLIRFFLLLLFSRWYPKPIFKLDVIKKIVSYSSYVVGFGSMNYWARNADNLIIGRVLGASLLGFYNQAYKLMMIPYQSITGIINPTLHPILSNLQNDRKRLRKSYLKILIAIGSLSSVVAAFMFSWSEEVIITLFGEQWRDSILVFSYLSIVSAIQPITATTGPVLLASNKAGTYFRAGIFSSFVYILGFLVTVQYGIEAVGMSYIITNLIVSPVVFYITYHKVLGGNPRDIFKVYTSIFLVFISYYYLSFIIKYLVPTNAFLFRLFYGGLLALVLIGGLMKSELKDLCQSLHQKK